MKTIALNLLAVLAGVVVGSLVNIGILNVGPSLIPLPEGADISTREGLRDSMMLFTPVNFVCPFLAHALGTLVGAFVAAKIAASRKMTFAICIALFFLMGGAAMVYTIGGPMWFNVSDLLLAYIPMGFLGGRLAGGKKRQSA